MHGTVKFFDRKKGFGFIIGEDGTEYFVHYTGLKEGTDITENDTVVFGVEEGDRGKKAVDVEKSEGTGFPDSEVADKAEEQEDRE